MASERTPNRGAKRSAGSKPSARPGKENTKSERSGPGKYAAKSTQSGNRGSRPAGASKSGERSQYRGPKRPPIEFNEYDERSYRQLEEGGERPSRSTGTGPKKSFSDRSTGSRPARGSFDKKRSSEDRTERPARKPFVARRDEESFNEDTKPQSRRPYTPKTEGETPRFSKPKPYAGKTDNRSGGYERKEGGSRSTSYNKARTRSAEDLAAAPRRPTGYKSRTPEPEEKRRPARPASTEPRSESRPPFREKPERERAAKSDFKKKEFAAKPKTTFQKGKGKINDQDEPPTYNLRQFQNKEGGTEGEERIRLNRYIANSGVCSRREADALIAAGEIKVNGEVITEMGYLVKPADSVQYGRKILNREKLVYVLLNKPKGFITTTEDPEERRTVMELVASASKERLFPVGRLDRNTTGLLLFTNDGELAQKLTHPSHETTKVYQVELDKPLEEEHLEQIKAGVELEDGPVQVDEIAIITDDRLDVGVELHIGRNRIVRRLFESFGYEVVKLDRVFYAGLTKKDLARGQWRYLSEEEVIRLKYFL